MKFNLRSVGFIFLHLMLLSIFYAGFSLTAFIAFILIYLLKIFFLSAGSHRYFSHRAFKTSRFFQFILAVMAAAGGQRGPLWWSSYHRLHHTHSDTSEDYHSPAQHGFWYAHIGWLLEKEFQKTKNEFVGDFKNYPELFWVDKYHPIFYIGSSVFIVFVGWWLGINLPHLKTNALQFFSWGVIATSLLSAHLTMSINSIMHSKKFGYQNYDTKDNTSNIPWVWLALGEQFHHNHHYLPNSASNIHRAGEWDLVFVVLKFLGRLGIIWDLKIPSFESESKGYTLLFKKNLNNF